MSKGLCYQSAGRYVIDHQNDQYASGLRLCHGTVIGTSGNVEGKRYGHAWVELLDDIVIDTEMEKATLRDLYYKIGQVSDVKRYTIEEAQIKMLETKHWGPWE